MTTPDTPARSTPASYFTTAPVSTWYRGMRMGPDVPVGVELRYHRDDPFAVTLLLDLPHAMGTQVEWRFARQMLADSRTGLAGDPHGDVALRRCDCAAAHVVMIVADRAARCRYRFPLQLVDVNAALLAFDQLVALDAAPIAPSLDAIGAGLRALLEQEAGQDGDR